MEGLRERRRNNDIKKISLISTRKTGVKRFDLFPKVEDDYVIQTNGGGYGLNRLNRLFCSISDYVVYSVYTLYC